MKDTKPGGNIAKDLPGHKLPLTPAGDAAWKHNTTATVDPEAICILGGIPRHNASGLPFMVLETSQYVAFLYFYSYYRLIPTDWFLAVFFCLKLNEETFLSNKAIVWHSWNSSLPALLTLKYRATVIAYFIRNIEPNKWKISL